MPNIVLTGASGFIGRHLHSRLIAHGADVIAVSRRRREHMQQVDDYAQSPHGDVMIHLGEEPDRALVNKAGEFYVQSSGTVVAALATRGYRRLIYLSSGAVYGDISPLPRKPGDAVMANDIYNRAKLNNERIVLAAGGAVVRLSNIYGEGMSMSNVLSEIIAQIPGHDSLSVRDARPVRDYLHVSDLSEALVRFVDSDYRGIINIGTGIGTSVQRLAELALSIVGQQGREIVSKNPMSTPFSTNILDITQTSSILDWRPKVDLVDGLARIIYSRTGLIHG
jgi:UDP-glucose 4-epimerase